MQKLFTALVTFRDKVSSVKKWAENPFFESHYADLPSILEVIKDPLKESWLAISHKCKSTDWWFVVVTTLGHAESWESTESEFPVFGNKPQEIGSSISYARRYNLLALLDIPTEDDDGNTANTAPRTKKEYVDTPTWWTKPKTPTSPNEYCPECGEQCETKKGTTKEWRPYEMGTCSACETKFFVNRKDLSNQPF